MKTTEETYRGIHIYQTKNKEFTGKGIVWMTCTKDRLKEYIDEHLNQGTAKVVNGGFLFQ